MYFVVIGFLLFQSGCAFTIKKPCSQAGQSPHEGPFQGKKRCFQVKDSTGDMVNEGNYMEWFTNEKIRIVGEYHLGKKTGRWIEYDDTGKKISDLYFLDGKEVKKP